MRLSTPFGILCTLDHRLLFFIQADLNWLRVEWQSGETVPRIKVAAHPHDSHFGFSPQGPHYADDSKPIHHSLNNLMTNTPM